MTFRHTGSWGRRANRDILSKKDENSKLRMVSTYMCCCVHIVSVLREAAAVVVLVVGPLVSLPVAVGREARRRKARPTSCQQLPAVRGQWMMMLLTPLSL